MDFNNLRFKPRLIESVTKLKDTLGDSIDKIYIFGSLARGKGNLNSDIDLLVSMKDKIPERKLRFLIYDDVCEEDENGLSIDLKFCVRDRLNTFSPVFNKEVQRDKVLIFEKGELLWKRDT